MTKKQRISIITILIFISATLSFGNPNVNAKEQQQQQQQLKTQTPNPQEQKGFLYNIRELKEISDVMDVIIENHVGEQVPDKTTLLHGALKGMADSLGDPHTNYFTKKEMESFMEDMKGEYPGVGMIIQKKSDEYLMVVSPIEDTPAYKAGIKPKDRIIEIDGASTIGLTSEESAKKLKGKAGTKVMLKVYRESIKETKEIELTRKIIKLNYVKSKMLENNIGYLRLTQFGENVSEIVEKELKALQKKGAKGIILDLRSNPGGSLDEAIKISSLFVKEERIVSTKRKDGVEEIGTRKGTYRGDIPLVILINGGSASASEIVSGAVKDYKRGTLIGEKTFGKGSVQTLIPFPDGDGLKLTIAKYYTPAGITIHGVGIEPDIKVEEDENYMLFDGMITNIDEKAQKENKKEIIEAVKGKEEAEKYQEKIDYQLEKAIEVLSKKLGKTYVAKEKPKTDEKVDPKVEKPKTDEKVDPKAEKPKK